METEQHLQYLFRSLQHHPSPYLIYELDGSIRWANIAAQFILRIKDLSDLSIKVPKKANKIQLDKDEIASSYDTPIEVKLRKIRFFMRSRVHLIPIKDSEGFLLIEILCSSRSGLEALQQTISCIEFDRIDLAYQKQLDLKTNEITGVEALLRMRNEQGNIIPNDVIIPQIEGESLFSLVVLSSLEKLKESHRTILVLREMEELSYEDLSAVLGCSIGRVKSRLYEARMQLRGILKREN